MQEYRRNQILLNLARNIFEEQNNLECLVTKIMTEAKELLKCERCAVYLLDLDCGEAVSEPFFPGENSFINFSTIYYLHLLFT